MHVISFKRQLIALGFTKEKKMLVYFFITPMIETVEIEFIVYEGKWSNVFDHEIVTSLYCVLMRCPIP